MTTWGIEEFDASQPISVLVIEDEPIHRQLIASHLRCDDTGEFRCDEADSVADARAKLQRARYDCVILDHGLPDGSGWDVLSEMWQSLLTTPVIGLSTTGDPEVALEDFRRGCVEFLPKSEAFRQGHLRERLLGALSRHRQRMAAAAALPSAPWRRYAPDASTSDALTGVLSAEAGRAVHARVHAEAAARGEAYALCVVDLDQFTRFNARHGRAEGDRVLALVARAIRACLRDTDRIARSDGAGFVLLLDRLDAGGVRRVIERVRRSVDALGLTHEDNPPHRRVTASAGVAVRSATGNETAEAVRLRAEDAARRAVARGRNRVHLDDASTEEGR